MKPKLHKYTLSKNCDERIIVAEEGTQIDWGILVHDNSSYVRRAVAKHGGQKEWDVLVHDCYWSVRRIVAKYAGQKELEILSKDNDSVVKNIALKRLEELKIFDNLLEEIVEIL